MRKRSWSGNKHFRLMLTLELAVMLPAAALIFVNFHHLEAIKRDKNVEATIHRDFQYVLAVSEKKIDQKMYAMAEEMRESFPSPDTETDEKTKRLDLILSKNPMLAHAFIYDAEKGLLFRSQPGQLTDPSLRQEHDRVNEMFGGWFGLDGRMLCEVMREKSPGFSWYGDQMKRSTGYAYMTSAFFAFPELSKDRTVFGGVSFDPDYLKLTFFPTMLEQVVTQKMNEVHGCPLAMVVYPSDHDGRPGDRLVAASTGWEGKPEVSRNLDNVFRGLSLGIRFQGTSADAMASHWIQQSLLILGALSLLMIGGLVFTYRSVSKEMALARLKSDFVSNVSHELRTPLSLIQLYAETLELGRIKSQEKKEEYYHIMRKESERLGKLINNILDFSRIEAGRKEYDLRETDIGELVRSTLDAYRYQIEKNGFEFETSIDSNIPTMRLDREAIARALVNLVNNALKYSADDKFLFVKLHRATSAVKLEVVDHGIGIARREQSKIFEKFYRTCDPLVHDTKGSGLGLSLVRHITHAHGGQVEVESTPGKGSKFTLSLPLPADAGQQQASSLASQATAS
jgi:signal transduction histidine kinase